MYNKGCPDYWAMVVDLNARCLSEIPKQAPKAEVGDDKRKNSDSVGTSQVAKVEKIPHISPPFPEVGGGRID